MCFEAHLAQVTGQGRIELVHRPLPQPADLALRSQLELGSEETEGRRTPGDAGLELEGQPLPVVHRDGERGPDPARVQHLEAAEGRRHQGQVSTQPDSHTHSAKTSPIKQTIIVGYHDVFLAAFGDQGRCLGDGVCLRMRVVGVDLELSHSGL